jgi:glycosyltransferase involved in cell wall biosynthesis
VSWPFRRDFDFATARAASRWIRDNHPDAVLVTTGRDIRSVGLAAKRRKIPVVWRMGPKPKNNLVHRLTGALITHVLAPSETVNRELQKFSWLRRKITVIPNGVAIVPRPTPEQVQAARAMLGLPNDKFLCLYVGRLMTGKGIDTLIEAFAEVNRTHPAAILWLVGAGPSDGLAREKVATFGLNNVVSFAGYSTDPSVYFAACDLFLLPSRYESFSYVLLEAMLHGKPCITTRAGAIPEVVGEDATVLVAPGDAKALAGAIVKLMNDDERRMELAEKGRQRVIDNFDLNKTVDAVETLFRTIIKTP